jgi:ABC-type bacteriocin/lantibiotic exporter with double-glycine peptidase domain
VSYKSQEPCFLEGTITEIVAPGEEAPDDARVSAALRSAGLGPALDRAELGLSRKAGTNGAGLSGGQRQMLAIARILYASRRLVLLDEPTLGLDRVAQDTLLDALKALKSSRCVVVATHTTELIQRADRVLVLDHGRLVADSTPAKLFGQSRAELQPA